MLRHADLQKPFTNAEQKKRGGKGRGALGGAIRATESRRQLHFTLPPAPEKKRRKEGS